LKVRQGALFVQHYQQRLYLVESALGVEVVGCQEFDAELSAAWVFVAFDGCAGFVAHAIPKGWWSLHFSFGLEGFDVLEYRDWETRS